MVLECGIERQAFHRSVRKNKTLEIDDTVGYGAASS
jgi:hypothetical protein